MTFRDIRDIGVAMAFWAGALLLAGFIGFIMWFLFNGAAALVCVALVVAGAGAIKGAMLRGEREAVEAWGAEEGHNPYIWLHREQT